MEVHCARRVRSWRLYEIKLQIRRFMIEMVLTRFKRSWSTTCRLFKDSSTLTVTFNGAMLKSPACSHIKTLGAVSRLTYGQKRS